MASSGSRGVLWLGVLAATVLISVAWSPLVQPRDSGQRELAARENQIESSLLLSWNQLRTEPGKFPMAWEANWKLEVSNQQWLEDSDLPTAEAELWLQQADSGHPAFDILLSEAEQKELEENNLESAIAHCQEALALDTDVTRQARGRLRLMQLFLKSGKTQEALQIWNDTFSTFVGTETLNQYPIYLVAYLAISEHISAEDKSAADRHLASLLDQNQLAMPLVEVNLLRGAEGNIVDLQVDSETQSWINAIQSQASPELLQATHNFLKRFVISKLKSHWRVFNKESLIEIHSAELDCLIVQRDGLGGSVEIHLVSESEFTRALAAIWQDQGLLNGGFAANIYPFQRSSAGLEVKGAGVAKEGLSLPETPFRVKAWHPDPEAFIATAARPFLALRWGLSLLGLFCAAAGISIQRVVTRQQRLQRMKTEFVANVSHELRTPISSILLMAENLETGKVSKAESIQNYHELIKQEAHRLRRLVDDVLDFSRLERGERPEPRLQPTAILEWKADLENEAVKWALQSGMKLSTKDTLPELTIPLDAEAMRRAVLNLIDNALRHSGGTKIDLSFSASEHEFIISVRDHGVGIPSGSESKLFEPFLQLGSGSVKGKGAGLGLAIVAQIAADHGGTATAKNATGGGAIFSINIPIPQSASA